MLSWCGQGLCYNVYSRTGHEGPEGVSRYGSTLSLTSALDWGAWLTPGPGWYTPSKVTRYSLCSRLGRLVWMGAENLSPTEIRSPGRPARSE